MPQPEPNREAQRVLAEYRRRREEVDTDLYAPWNPAEQLMRDGRRRLAARLLRRFDAFPDTNSLCLEVGYGELGWLGELISWGVPETRLCGIELDTERAAVAQARLPSADLRVGDAAELPWQAETFQLVVVSTVFTSILDDAVRRRLAGEIERVLAPSGALLWYDFAFNNPGNRAVRRVDRSELRNLFPGLHGDTRRITLAPPLLRRIAPWSPWLASTLEAAVPWLRTHLLAVLVKPDVEAGTSA